MIAFERLKKLCDEQKISINDLESQLNFATNTLYSWKKFVPKGANLIKVADYFDVSVDYLLGRSDKKRYWDWTDKDERDIQKKLQELINSVSDDEGFAMFDGGSIDELDEDTRKALIVSLESALRFSKILAKKRFTPKKHR